MRTVAFPTTNDSTSQLSIVSSSSTVVSQPLLRIQQLTVIWKVFRMSSKKNEEWNSRCCQILKWCSQKYKSWLSPYLSNFSSVKFPFSGIRQCSPFFPFLKIRQLAVADVVMLSLKMKMKIPRRGNTILLIWNSTKPDSQISWWLSLSLLIAVHEDEIPRRGNTIGIQRSQIPESVDGCARRWKFHESGNSNHSKIPRGAVAPYVAPVTAIRMKTIRCCRNVTMLRFSFRFPTTKLRLSSMKTTIPRIWNFLSMDSFRREYERTSVLPRSWPASQPFSAVVWKWWGWNSWIFHCCL